MSSVKYRVGLVARDYAFFYVPDNVLFVPGLFEDGLFLTGSDTVFDEELIDNNII